MILFSSLQLVLIFIFYFGMKGWGKSVHIVLLYAAFAHDRSCTINIFLLLLCNTNFPKKKERCFVFPPKKEKPTLSPAYCKQSFKAPILPNLNFKTNIHSCQSDKSVCQKKWMALMRFFGGTLRKYVSCYYFFFLSL